MLYFIIPYLLLGLIIATSSSLDYVYGSALSSVLRFFALWILWLPMLIVSLAEKMILE